MDRIVRHVDHLEVIDGEYTLVPRWRLWLRRIGCWSVVVLAVLRAA